MRIKNYTPVFDRITKELDPLASLVFGRVWRYSQMKNGQCEASLQTLADDTGLSVDTVRRRIETLMKADYLSEKKYEIGFTRKLTPNYDVMVTSELVRIAESDDSPIREQGEGIAESDTKRDIKKDKDITELKKGTAKAVKEGLHLASTIRCDFQKHLGLTPNWDTKTNQQYYQFFRERYVDGQTAEMFATWWRSDDFRAKQNISLFKVKEQWYQAFMNSKQEYDPVAERSKHEQR